MVASVSLLVSVKKQSSCLVVKVVPSAPAALDSETDYSDPFDVRPDPRGRPNLEPKPALTDCCSYMEPFEAQRIISGAYSNISDPQNDVLE